MPGKKGGRGGPNLYKKSTSSVNSSSSSNNPFEAIAGDEYDDNNNADGGYNQNDEVVSNSSSNPAFQNDNPGNPFDMGHEAAPAPIAPVMHNGYNDRPAPTAPAMYNGYNDRQAPIAPVMYNGYNDRQAPSAYGISKVSKKPGFREKKSKKKKEKKSLMSEEDFKGTPFDPEYPHVISNKEKVKAYEAKVAAEELAAQSKASQPNQPQIPVKSAPIQPPIQINTAPLQPQPVPIKNLPMPALEQVRPPPFQAAVQVRPPPVQYPVEVRPQPVQYPVAVRPQPVQALVEVRPQPVQYPVAVRPPPFQSVPFKNTIQVPQQMIPPQMIPPQMIPEQYVAPIVENFRKPIPQNNISSFNPFDSNFDNSNKKPSSAWGQAPPENGNKNIKKPINNLEQVPPEIGNKNIKNSSNDSVEIGNKNIKNDNLNYNNLANYSNNNTWGQQQSTEASYRNYSNYSNQDVFSPATSGYATSPSFSSPTTPQPNQDGFEVYQRKKYKEDSFLPYQMRKKQDPRSYSRDVSGRIEKINIEEAKKIPTLKWMVNLAKTYEQDNHEKLRFSLLNALNKSTLGGSRRIATELKPAFGNFEKRDLDAACAEILRYYMKCPHLGNTIAELCFDISATEIEYRTLQVEQQNKKKRKMQEINSGLKLVEEYEDVKERNPDQGRAEDDEGLDEESQEVLNLLCFKPQVLSFIDASFAEIEDTLRVADVEDDEELQWKEGKKYKSSYGEWSAEMDKEEKALQEKSTRREIDFEKKCAIMEFVSHLTNSKFVLIDRYISHLRSIAKIAKDSTSEKPMIMICRMLLVGMRFVLMNCQALRFGSDAEKTGKAAKQLSGLKFLTDFLKKRIDSDPKYSLRLRCLVVDVLIKKKRYEDYSGLGIPAEEEQERREKLKGDERTVDWKDLAEKSAQFKKIAAEFQESLPKIQVPRDIQELSENQTEYFYLLMKTRLIYYLTMTDGQKYYAIMKRLRRFCTEKKLNFNCAIFFLFRLLEEQPSKWSPICSLITNLRNDQTVDFGSVPQQTTFGYFQYLKRFFDPDTKLDLDCPILGENLVKIRRRLIDEDCFNDGAFVKLCEKEMKHKFILEQIEAIKQRTENNKEIELMVTKDALEAKNLITESLKKRCETAKKEIDGLKKENSGLKNENLTVKNENESMKKEIERLQALVAKLQPVSQPSNPPAPQPDNSHLNLSLE